MRHSQSNHHIDVEFAVLDPFNVSFLDKKTNKIYVDVKFKKSEKLDEIIKHEIAHQTNPFQMETLNFSILPEIVKYKPLHLLQVLFPFALAKTKENKIVFGIDPLGLIFLFIFMVAISTILTYHITYCENSGSSEVCYKCGFFTCEKLVYKPLLNK